MLGYHNEPLPKERLSRQMYIGGLKFSLTSVANTFQGQYVALEKSGALLQAREPNKAKSAYDVPERVSVVRGH
jgi:hypothetical protein